jgi:hypothetical protein
VATLIAASTRRAAVCRTPCSANANSCRRSYYYTQTRPSTDGCSPSTSPPHARPFALLAHGTPTRASHPPHIATSVHTPPRPRLGILSHSQTIHHSCFVSRPLRAKAAPPQARDVKIKPWEQPVPHATPQLEAEAEMVAKEMMARLDNACTAIVSATTREVVQQPHIPFVTPLALAPTLLHCCLLISHAP